MIESTQVRLRLVSPNKEIFNSETGETVSGKDILTQMKKNNVWKNDQKGKYAPIQFDSLEFQFREGETITVSETVAKALIRGAVLTVGSDKLNGPMVPYIEIAETYELGAPTKEERPKTACPICGVDQKTFPALTRHMGQERKKHPELFAEEATNWEAEEKEAV